MELTAMITMDPAEARRQLREYRGELHRRADDEYRAVAQGLEALAEGRPVLHLTQAIAGAGIDPQGFPRLAVARADRRSIMGSWAGSSVWFDFDARANPQWGTQQSDTLQRRIDMGRGIPDGLNNWTRRFSLVPMVPPPGIRKIGGFTALRRHFILWEVERWYERLPNARADRDPYLIRHLAGDLYAVVHEWDLTELERAVMTARRS